MQFVQKFQKKKMLLQMSIDIENRLRGREIMQGWESGNMENV